MNNTTNNYYIVFVYQNKDYEHMATVSGKNAQQRAKEYAKQILAPDRAEVVVVSEGDFALITAQL